MEVCKNLSLENIEGEIWKEISGYNGDYFVSNMGRVKSLKFGKEKILKQSKDGSGYLRVVFNNRSFRKDIEIHRLVYETFKEKLEKNYICHHKDKNKNNNFISNLEKKLHSKHISEHNKGKNFSKNHKLKISESNKGKIFSDKHRMRISETRIKKIRSGEILTIKGKDHYFYGKFHSEQTKFKISNSLKGEKSTNSKLKNGEVWLIKKILNSDYYRCGKINQEFIGKMFNINKRTISAIKNNKIWTHVELVIK